jgi:redox-sensitive bicupin YhaK (pirin superfamily)
MTAASGILHEEFHSRAFTKKGGMLEMVQLWVNLPAKAKNADPGYQTLLDADIPAVDLPEGAGRLRVIAGEFDGRKGPAKTFTPIDIYDVKLNRNGIATINPRDGHTVVVVVLKGTVLVNGGEIAREAQFALLDRSSGEVRLEANGEASVLVLSGEPIEEPVVMRGPFVMNTEDEIRQAMIDFQSGRFGTLEPVASDA